MTKWNVNGASSSVLLLWLSVAEGVLLVLIGLLSPFWLPARLCRARDFLTARRQRVLLLRGSGGGVDGGGVGGGGGGGGDDKDGDEGAMMKGAERGTAKPRREGGTKPAALASAAASTVEGLPDLGKRYLDFLAQALGQSREAAAAAEVEAAAPHLGGSFPYHDGIPSEKLHIDVSAYDEVVLTTELEADGFLAACMLFAIVTAEVRRIPVKPGRVESPYPLRTLVVGEGKTAQAHEAIAAMRQMELVPRNCIVDVVEGCRTSAAAVTREERQQGSGGGREGGGEEGAATRSFMGPCSPTPLLLLLLRSSFLGTIFGRLCCKSGEWRRDSAGSTKLRELFAATRRQNQRVLVVALKPPRDLVQVLLEGRVEPRWWKPKGMGRRTFKHIDLFVSGGFCSAFAGREGQQRCQELPRWRRRGDNAEDLLSRDEAEKAMAEVNRVFVVQLDDLARPYGFPKAIAPDRIPTLSAAVAGARGILPSCLRRVIGASNHSALTSFPDKVAAAISAGRYANEELRATASSIAASAAAAEEPGMSRGRVAELGACMADLIASDFEALEAAGLRPGTHQAVFRSLGVGMALSDVTAAWALACQDAVCWKRCPRVGIDTTLGRIAPLHDGRGARGGHAQGYGCSRHSDAVRKEDSSDDGDDFEDGGDPGATGNSFRRGKGDLRVSSRQPHVEEAFNKGDGDGACRGFRGVVATGFARGFERLEDQEAGYANFAAFLVRVLDQMP